MDADFHPYPAFTQALPGVEKDFFRTPLPEVEHRRFLAICPRNVDREYTPPHLNHVDVNPTAKRFDNQLSDIQFRLSGITRPIDQLVHAVIRDDHVSKHDTLEFANVVHELLLDTASHITQLHIDNMFKAAGIQGQAPRLQDTGSHPLLDPREFVDHVKLANAVQKTGRHFTRHKKGKAHSSRTNRPDEEPSPDRNKPKGGYNGPKKDFRSSPPHRDNNKSNATSQ
ncbi:hypothetical protein BJV82DRAFT_527686 [Fennellomyces sp. T-0311]|nr:hypothetical protein BJV82DRAFT_527686 [Fennellomyces sp. T-0311]